MDRLGALGRVACAAAAVAGDEATAEGAVQPGAETRAAQVLGSARAVLGVATQAAAS